jgi:hypothetical protein
MSWRDTFYLDPDGDLGVSSFITLADELSAARPMQELVWKLRIAMLWIFFGVAMPTAMLLWMVEPGAIKEIMTGTVEGEDLSGPAMIVMALFQHEHHAMT